MKSEKESPKIYYIMLLVCFLINLIYFITIDWDYKNQNFIIFFFLSFMVVMFVEAYRPRKCPTCGKYMKQKYGHPIKRFYTCKDCNFELEINVGIGDRNS